MSERDYDVVEALQALSAETGRDVPQLALNWTLHQPGVTSALVGCRTVEQVRLAPWSGAWDHGRRGLRCESARRVPGTSHTAVGIEY